MERVRLRPHHIDLLVDNREKYFGLKGKLLQMFTAITYRDWKFSRDFVRFMNSVNDEIPLEVVSGVDDICNLGCPYLDYCSSGRSYITSQKISSQIPLLIPKIIRTAFARLSIEGSDEFYKVKYGLKEGESYRLKDIKIVRQWPNPNLLTQRTPNI